ncbi:MAG: chromosome segregation protein SMC [Oscillospiraceae bacterium]|nr:chromosome segregation protein SMC [Oscillospiraceae bacterium]
MYLKALELAGFKSFPERTRLTFEKPITAIVGPNGSGKSNIADALQWVMGEMSSKALRGGKMEDVIFGGTVRRSQLGYAEVTLTLDNSDGGLDVESDEVEVTRRYYRSGESEYYINRKAVRLRDVNELFMDTGLGRDGYSIIGQGKIDSILSAKSTDRREIFEEAAGISRFRHRKEESERKLQRAEEDLTRVNDKISELEMQVEPLRKQSEVAKKYLVLRDELRGLEISLWMHELDELADKHRKLEQEALQANGVLEKAKSELEALYAAGDEYAAKMHDKDIEAESMRARISAAESSVNESESREAVLKTDLSHTNENIKRIDEELKAQAGQASGIDAQIAEREERLSAIGKEKAALGERAAENRRRSEKLTENESENQRAIAELTEKVDIAAAELSEKRTRLGSVAASMQEVEDRESGLLTEINSETERLEKAKGDFAAHRKALSDAEEKANGIRNIVNGYKLRMKGKQEKLEKTRDSYTTLTMDHNALTSRIQLLSDMEKDYEGYSRAVKTVMREKGRGTLRGIHGPAGELIKTESRYSIAIETAMGGAMQNIIVGTENDGKAAINLLKRLDAGRVTLLPMSVIRGSSINERGLESEEGFEGVAYDLVSFDRQYSDIYLSILGRTAIVEDMDSAVRIAGKYGHRFRIVTLDGQVLNAGGSMTGGSISKNTGILSRANELKSLSEKETGMREKLEALRVELETLKREVSAGEYELSVSNDELREAEDILTRLNGETGHYRLLIESIEEHIEALKSERNGSKTRSTDLRASADALKAEIAGLEKLSEKARAELESSTAGREELSDARRALMDEDAEIRAALASLEAEAITQTEAAAQLRELRSGMQEGSEKQRETRDSLVERSKELEKAIEQCETEIAARRASVQNLKEKLDGINNERMNVEAERVRGDKLAQEKNRRLLDLEREASRVEQRRQAAEMEEKTLVDKLWDSYELTRTTAQSERKELESYQTAKRRTGEIRRSMSSLGTPNLGAIEEFERVNTRYTYLTEQRDDIEKSRTELLGIISDITGEMENIFRVEFDKINESFQKTFLDLFGGGKAALELEDPNSILDCGIEIKVQPPGKTLKTITLLSGGEKAFVAIALYYAILKVRPTPFVIMDEIEAALDEARVVATADYMRTLTGKTQFLVITHRRGTMEEADVLFGVTMQEQGVSKVLKMDVEEAEKTLTKD